MKTFTAGNLHLLLQVEVCRQPLTCQTDCQCNTFHKSPVTKPFVTFLGPFISEAIRTGIYFALDEIKPKLPGTPSVCPTNKVTGEK